MKNALNLAYAAPIALIACSTPTAPLESAQANKSNDKTSSAIQNTQQAEKSSQDAQAQNPVPAGEDKKSSESIPAARQSLKLPSSTERVIVSPIFLPASLTKGTKVSATYLVSNPNEPLQGLFATYTLKGTTLKGTPLANACPLGFGCSETSTTPFEKKIDLVALEISPKGTSTRFFSFDVPVEPMQDGKLNICFTAFTDSDRKNAVSENICWDATIIAK